MLNTATPDQSSHCSNVRNVTLTNTPSPLAKEIAQDLGARFGYVRRLPYIASTLTKRLLETNSGLSLSRADWIVVVKACLDLPLSHNLIYYSIHRCIKSVSAG